MRKIILWGIIVASSTLMIVLWGMGLGALGLDIKHVVWAIIWILFILVLLIGGIIWWLTDLIKEEKQEKRKEE